jgi:hypothetical protein
MMEENPPLPEEQMLAEEREKAQQTTRKVKVVAE